MTCTAVGAARGGGGKCQRAGRCGSAALDQLGRLGGVRRAGIEEQGAEISRLAAADVAAVTVQPFVRLGAAGAVQVGEQSQSGFILLSGLRPDV